MSTLAIQATRGEEFPRTFTSAVTDFGDWEQIEPLFQLLSDQLLGVNSAPELEAWLLHDSELNAVLDEEYSRRYIAMTCDTENKKIEAAYLHFIETIVPKIKPWADQLSRLYLACPARDLADRRRLEVLDRKTQNAVELFREENIPLQTEISKLSQHYQKVCGAMTVQWRGEEKTLQQMAPYQEEPDRAVREEAWRVVVDRRLDDRDALNTLYGRMLEIRTQIAKNAGFENFRDYQHQAYNRFDYAPADCFTFHDAIEKTVVPLVTRLNEERRAKLGVETLRPWDMAVDPDNMPPLKPFGSAAELEAGCAGIFARLDPVLAGEFETMRTRGLLDLDSRKGKAPGGYQSTLDEVRLPFIFMNAAGTNRDVFTLLHEGGHAFHAFASRQEPLLTYRSAPMEFCEVASMAMESFGMYHLDLFYSDAAEAKRARRRHFEDTLSIFPWIATIDAFQHWIYLNPDHSGAEREQKWMELLTRFDAGVDWSGLEVERGSLWHRQLHLFEVPFYYIEYGIAQLGALQLWLQFRDQPEQTLRNYRKGLALGGSRPLPELFAEAGIKFDFSAATMAPIMQALAAELELE